MFVVPKERQSRSNNMKERKHKIFFAVRITGNYFKIASFELSSDSYED